MFKMQTTPQFESMVRKFARSDKAAYQQIKKAIGLLLENPSHPSLRSRPIKGHKPLMEASVNMDIRIVWQYAGSNTILFYNVDRHDRPHHRRSGTVGKYKDAAPG